MASGTKIALSFEHHFLRKHELVVKHKWSCRCGHLLTPKKARIKTHFATCPTHQDLLNASTPGPSFVTPVVSLGVSDCPPPPSPKPLTTLPFAYHQSASTIPPRTSNHPLQTPTTLSQITDHHFPKSHPLLLPHPPQPHLHLQFPPHHHHFKTHPPITSHSPAHSPAPS